MTKRRTDNQLQTIIRKAQDELYRREEARRLKENAGMIGKCFRYRNSSSNASWWLYGMVTELNKHGKIVMWDFEQFDGYSDGDECIRIRLEHRKNGMTDWEEISRKDFDAVWLKLISHVASSSNQKLLEAEKRKA